MFSRLVYIAFGFAALWMVVMAFKHKGKIHIFKNKLEKEPSNEGSKEIQNN